MANWTVESGAGCNQEGNLITIPFKVIATTGPGGELPAGYSIPDFNFANLSLENARLADQLGPVKGWRFNPVTGVLTLDSSARVSTTVVLDLKVEFESLQAVVTFTLAISLTSGGPIAVNNDSITPSGTYVNGLRTETEGWVSLRFRNSAGAIKTLPAPPDIAAADLHFEPSRAGKLPSGSLKLSVDSHAAWVQPPSGAKTNMGTWNDLAGLNNLTGAGSVPDLTGNAAGDPPRVNFDSASPTNPGRFVTDATPPVLTSDATIAAYFRADDTNTISTIVGRWNSNYADGRSWRLYVDNTVSPRKVVYQTINIAGNSVVNNEFTIGDAEDAVFLILRRDNAASDNTEVWINGVPQPPATSNPDVDDGDGVLSIGARLNSGSDWAEAFVGDLGQVALYDASLGDYQMSLVTHIMAQRALVEPGTPIPNAYHHQPYNPASNRALKRRPIANIRLDDAGKYNNSPFCQNPGWRPPTGTDQEKQAAVEAYLRSQVRAALVGCDQFEIMFNRPAGQYADDIPTSLITGEAPDGEHAVEEYQWAAMEAIWNEFGLSDHTDDAAGLRRGWFYTGSGLALGDDGAINPTGNMGNRVVGPLNADAYLAGVLNQWASRDTRYRCLFLDAAIQFYAKLVEVLHDSAVNEAFTLVGEAIPQSAVDGNGQPFYPDEYNARKGSPWFAQARNASAPWWNINPDTDRTDRKWGYNVNWQAGPWDETPIYFGILSTGVYINFNIYDDNHPPELDTGEDMTLGDIYRLSRKGAAPIAFFSQFAKTGAAWDYATGRIPVSRYANSPRICRVARV